MKITQLLVIGALASIALLAHAAERPYLRTADEITALRAGRSPEVTEKVLARWQRYLEMTDEETWALLPGPRVYRAMGVNRTQGCPNCGTKAYDAGGLWPFKCDMWEAPWQVTCPSCGEVFPKNDFGAFYESGLTPDGLFDPERADRKLLFNTEHPDANDPLHTHGVDDGTGWVDADGNRFWFIARYCGYLWVQVTKDARAMADDYQRTGAPQLAHKVGIVLARMADTYAEMDFSTQGVHPGSYKLGGDKGKAIWACGPTSEAVRMRLMLATYDDVWDIFDHDADLVEFLTQQAGQIGRPEWAGSAQAIRKHIEQELIAEGARDVMRTRAAGSNRYGGDVGHMAWTIVLQASVLDDEKLKQELLAWPFQGPFPLRGGMHEVLSGPILGREGAGGSSSPGYSGTHYRMSRTLADLYAKIEGPQQRDLHADYPCIKRSYDSQFSLNCCERYYPHIGDSGKCGSPGLICNPATMLEALEKFGDERYAQMAYFLNRHSTGGFPAEVAERVEAIIAEHGDYRPVSTNLNGYGLAILRSGEGDHQRAAWMYYGCAVTNSHTHLDRLNIGLFAHGLNLMPDLGYPERTGAWPKRGAWTNNTISHNTVVVDRERQKRAVVGSMNLFCRSPLVRLIDVSREAVYPQTALYRRTYAMIDIPDEDSYLVDIFRVKGGQEHHLSFHSAEGEVVTEGLKLARQATGTLAGPDVEFGDFDPKEQGWSYPGVGFQYLRNVERDASPPEQWSVTWQVEDTWNVLGNGKRAPTEVRLRLTMLGACDEVILADGEPPRLGKPNNPEALKYLLVQNSGDDLSSVYVSVIEPYQGASNLRSIERLPVEPASEDVEGMDAVAIRVEHADGVVDYVLSAHDGSVARRIGDLQFAGQWGFVRVRDGKTEAALLVGGTLLCGGDFELRPPLAQYEGTITDMDREMDAHNCIYTDADLPAGDALAGNWLRIANDGGQDACYEIKAIHRERGRTVVVLGDTTFIRCVKDPESYEAGYTYNFEVGDTFTIPVVARLESKP